MNNMLRRNELDEYDISKPDNADNDELTLRVIKPNPTDKEIIHSWLGISEVYSEGFQDVSVPVGEGLNNSQIDFLETRWRFVYDLMKTYQPDSSNVSNDDDESVDKYNRFRYWLGELLYVHDILVMQLEIDGYTNRYAKDTDQYGEKTPGDGDSIYDYSIDRAEAAGILTYDYITQYLNHIQIVSKTRALAERIRFLESS